MNELFLMKIEEQKVIDGGSRCRCGDWAVSAVGS